MELFFSFNDSISFLANFETNFLSNVTNKTNLNEYWSQKFLKLRDNDNQTICITYNDTVILNDNKVLTENLIKWSEEASEQVKKTIPESSDIQ